MCVCVEWRLESLGSIGSELLILGKICLSNQVGQPKSSYTCQNRAGPTDGQTQLDGKELRLKRYREREKFKSQANEKRANRC